MKTDPIELANRHLAAIQSELNQHSIHWHSVDSPKGSRAFEGKSGQYKYLITQFNELSFGIGYMGVVITTAEDSPTVINLPPALVDVLFHQAAARSN